MLLLAKPGQAAGAISDFFCQIIVILFSRISNLKANHLIAFEVINDAIGISCY
jgi:hypothetical protein